MPLDDTARLERLGERAAELVQDGMLVGLGTGSTASAMIEALGRRLRDGLEVTGVATSTATFDQASQLGIPMVDLNDIDRLDLCIDGADEIDPGLGVVKGRGGALRFGTLVARRPASDVSAAARERLVNHLGPRMRLPVEVASGGWRRTAEEIASLRLAPQLRSREDGAPFLTDGGHYILDCSWPGESAIDPGSL